MAEILPLRYAQDDKRGVRKMGWVGIANYSRGIICANSEVLVRENVVVSMRMLQSKREKVPFSPSAM
jgi:hypothetical protein